MGVSVVMVILVWCLRDGGGGVCDGTMSALVSVVVLMAGYIVIVVCLWWIMERCGPGVFDCCGGVWRVLLVILVWYECG